MSKKLKKLKAELKAARKALYNVEAGDDPDEAMRELDVAYGEITRIRDEIIELSIVEAKHAEEVRRLVE